MSGTQPRDRAAFLDAYDEAMRRWPAGTDWVDLDSAYGTTRAYRCGATGARPVVLLAAYGATSAVWSPLAHDLVADHRVYGVDVPGDPGRSVAGGSALDTPADLRRWLGSVLDGVGAARAHLIGHSYGAWIALDLALGEPGRVSALTLLDPTMCFTPILKGYIFRATPVMVRPSGDRRTALIRWESRGVPLNEPWLELTALGTDAFGLTSTVPTKIPSASAFDRLQAPTTVVLAGRSRVLHARTAARRAAARSTLISTHTLADASHYGLPMTHPQQIAELVRAAEK
jgi:pimeloyl-ACP methyl ester carboxylesterase